jgi:hypothetical protein
MAIDISKVFKANVKAIRMHLSDGTDKSDILNEEILNSNKKRSNVQSKKEPSYLKEARNIVIKKLFFKKSVQNSIFFII